MTTPLSNAHLLALFVAMGVVTVVCRCFFFITEREILLPEWLKRGLRFAPLAALGAVVLPEILITHDHLIDTFRDARIYATLAATAWYFWRRDVLGTIIVGMMVLIPLKLMLGW